MSSVNTPKTPSIPAAVARKGAIPAVLLAALTSPLAYTTLERLEGNVLRVYADKLADGIPTYCAGRTDWQAPVGAKLTSDECREVNKATILEYGYAVLGCTEWKYLSAPRLIGLTMFAVNVGAQAACGSQAIRTINAGQIGRGCDLLARTPSGAPNWSFASGVYVQGLQNRRQAERALCLAEPEPAAGEAVSHPKTETVPQATADAASVLPAAVPAPWWRRAIDWLSFWRAS